MSINIYGPLQNATTGKIYNADDIQQTTDGQLITTAEKTKLQNLQEHWRGSWNSSNVYAAGNIVRHLSEGEQRLFMATLAINSGQPAPPTGPAIGAWLEIDVKQSRGAWSGSNRYRFGDIVTHNGSLWMAIQTIAPSQPAPSLSNSSWVLIGPSRATTPITIQNTNVTLSESLFYVAFNGTSDVTYTIPSVSGDILNGSYWIIENASGSNTINLDEGDGIRTLGPSAIASGQMALITLEEKTGDDEGRIVIIAQPSFNFTGAGVSVSGTGGTRTVNIPSLFENRTEYTANQAIAATTQGVIVYTGSTAATFTLPTGLTASSEWQAWIVNDSTVLLNLDGAVGNVFGRITMRPSRAQFIYWNGTQFSQGPEKVFQKLGPSFEAFSSNDLFRNAAWTSQGQTGIVPSSGINFSGVNNVSWLGFRNRTVAFDFTQGVQYLLDWQSWSNASVNDGMSVINRDFSASTIALRPNGSDVFRYNGTDHTFSNPVVIPIPQENTDAGVIIVRGTVSGRWDVVDFVLEDAGATGASGNSDVSQNTLDTISVRAYNEAGEDLTRGQGIHIRGKNGRVSFEKADGTSFLNGFLVQDVSQNNKGNVVRFGQVTAPNVYVDETEQIGSPLNNDDVLYYDESASNVTNTQVVQSVTNTAIGYVVDSNFIYPENNQATGVVIDTQSEWDNWINKTQIKDFGTTATFEIPDIAEGSAEVTAVAGQQFIVQVPQGNGTISITPRGASTIESGYAGATISYTNASPLGLTGAIRPEYILIEVNSAADGYLYYEVNQRGIETTFVFDWTEYIRLKP